MHQAPHTGLGLQRLRGDEAGLNLFWDPLVPPTDMEVVHDVVRPEMVTIVMPKLGSGWYGTAYRCFVGTHELVVKVPNRVRPIRLKDYEDEQQRFVLPELDPEDFAESFATFATEAANAEAILEPAGFSQLFRGEQRRASVHVGAPLAQALKAEMEAICSHPGYDHIHQIVHTEVWPSDDTPYPMLFSEPCVGSLKEYAIEHCPFKSTGGHEWMHLARHLLRALEFLRWRKLAHLDVQPGKSAFLTSDETQRLIKLLAANVFIQTAGNGMPWYKLADFGACMGLDEALPRLRGTPEYRPTYGDDRTRQHQPIRAG